jgi:hypothetical protein
MLSNRILRTAARGWLCALLLGVAVVSVSASAQTRRPVAVGVTVFADPNYRGASASFRTDTPDLRPYALSDKISSIEIPAGEVWEVCQDINYANRCQTFSNSVPNLRSIGWNDRISSLRMVRGGFRGDRSTSSQSLVFYDRPGYRGASTVLTSGSSNLGSIGNRAESVEVRSGTWELCDRTGRCATVSQNVPDLSRLGLSGRITSARLVNNYQDPRDRRNGSARRDRYDGR